METLVTETLVAYRIGNLLARTQKWEGDKLFAFLYFYFYTVNLKGY